jgi:hypothetical protein
MATVDLMTMPMIQHATLVPLSASNTTFVYNTTCDECLCKSIPTKAVVNCFPNDTCQTIMTIPVRYRIQLQINARLYFPKGLIPNKSACCMPNITEVISRLQHGTQISVHVDTSRCLLLDTNGALVTSDTNSGCIRRYNPTNLASIDSIVIDTSRPFTITQYRQVYFIGLEDSRIMLIDSSNLNVLNIINSTHLKGVRDMIFLNDGHTMVVASTDDHFLVFFNKSNDSVINYIFSYKQAVNYTYPHGLLRVNDSYFYATSWTGNSIYSYTRVNSTFWNEALVDDARSMQSPSGGHHLSIDECGRHWFSLGGAGIAIFDDAGRLLTNYNRSGNLIFDAILTNNYVLYLSDLTSNEIFRIDPHIEC